MWLLFLMIKKDDAEFVSAETFPHQHADLFLFCWLSGCFPPGDTVNYVTTSSSDLQIKQTPRLQSVFRVTTLQLRTKEQLKPISSANKKVPFGSFSPSWEGNNHSDTPALFSTRALQKTAVQMRSSDLTALTLLFLLTVSCFFLKPLMRSRTVNVSVLWRSDLKLRLNVIQELLHLFWFKTFISSLMAFDDLHRFQVQQKIHFFFHSLIKTCFYLSFDSIIIGRRKFVLINLHLSCSFFQHPLMLF